MAIHLPEDDITAPVSVPVTGKAVIFKVVNNISFNIAPAIYYPIGPSNIPSEFQSKLGTGPSNPINIRFDSPIGQFSITIVGESFPGHTVQALDTNDNVIAQYTSLANVAMNDNGSLMAFSGDELHTVSLTVNTNVIASIILTPLPWADYVGYKNINIDYAAIIPTISPISPVIYVPLPVAPLAPVVTPVVPVVVPDSTPVVAPVVDTTPVIPDSTPAAVVITSDPIIPQVNPTPIPSVTIVPALVVPNAIRASNIKQCYDIAPEFSPFIHTYDLGIISLMSGIVYKIRNNMSNAVLQISLSLPEYLSCNLGQSFTINPLTIQSFSITFLESNFDSHIFEAQNRVLTHTTEMIVSVPNPPDAPILVSTNLPSLT